MSLVARKRWRTDEGVCRRLAEAQTESPDVPEEKRVGQGNEPVSSNLSVSCLFDVTRSLLRRMSRKAGHSRITGGRNSPSNGDRCIR